MEKTIATMMVLACVISVRADITAAVTTTERIGLAYNQLSVSVTVSNPSGVAAVKVILKDGAGSTVGTPQLAMLSGDSATVGFTELTPGATYSYDVLLSDGVTDAAPTGWKTVQVNLFSDVTWFGFEAGAFQWATPNENVEVKDLMYASKDDSLGILEPTKAPVEGKETSMSTRVEVKGAYAWSDLPSGEGAQFAIGLVLKEDEAADIPENRVWACKVGSGNWIALTSSDAPVTNGTYDIRTVLDYRAGQKVVSCMLLAGADSYSLLSNEPLTADQMRRVGVVGGGVISQSVNYLHMTMPTEVLPTGTQIELASSGEVDLAKLTEDASYTVTDHGYALCWKDTANRYATKSGNTLTLHTGTPANGLESFASHALGLDPTEKLAKPAAVVKAGGMQSATGVTVHVPNVVKENLPDAGVTVVHRLQRSTDQGATWADTGTEVGAGESLVVPFEDGVLFRVNTVLK